MGVLRYCARMSAISTITLSNVQAREQREGETSLMTPLCPDTVNMDEFDKSAWYAQSAVKASKETGDSGVAMILDHFRRVLKQER